MFKKKKKDFSNGQMCENQKTQDEVQMRGFSLTIRYHNNMMVFLKSAISIV